MATKLLQKLIVFGKHGQDYITYTSDTHVCFVKCDENGTYCFDDLNNYSVVIPKEDWNDLVEFINNQLKNGNNG